MLTFILVFASLIALFLGITLNIKFDNGVASKNSWHVGLYKRLWCFEDNYYLPENVCTYFWKYLLGILLLPLTIISVLLGLFWKRWRDEVDGQIVTFSVFIYILIGAAFTFGPMLWSINVSISDISLWKWIWTSLAGLGILSSILFGCYLLTEYLENRSLIFKSESMLVRRLKDWKNKSCTRITWK